jgi:hypothetical protein
VRHALFCIQRLFPDDARHGAYFLSHVSHLWTRTIRLAHETLNCRRQTQQTCESWRCTNSTNMHLITWPELNKLATYDMIQSQRMCILRLDPNSTDV